MFVQRASRFGAEIFLSTTDAQRINGKSIMGVMMLAAEKGAEITVEAEGVDAEEAVAALSELIASNFEDQN